MKIIAECGATKTDWVAIFADGTIRELRTEGVNFSVMSSSSSDDIIRRTVMALNINRENLTGMYIYAAGIVEPKVSGDVEYASDLLAAARSLFGHNKGIAAILGTGSNSCYYDGENIVKNFRAGGFILGDEGSAASLGRMFLSDFLKEMVPDTVAKAFEAEFDSSYASIVKNIYKGETPSRYLGYFAPWIIDWYGKDEYMTALIEKNFRLFFERALCRYDTDGITVGMVGGFASACRDIIKKVASEYGITISSIVESPMEGLVAYHNGQ